MKLLPEDPDERLQFDHSLKIYGHPLMRFAHHLRAVVELNSVQAGKVYAIHHNEIVTLHDILQDVMKSWEALPPGKHSPEQVQEWLDTKMCPAMKRLKDFAVR